MQREASAPDFWDDSDHAQGVMKELGELLNEVEMWQRLSGRLADAGLLGVLELAAARE